MEVIHTLKVSCATAVPLPFSPLPFSHFPPPPVHISISVRLESTGCAPAATHARIQRTSTPCIRNHSDTQPDPHARAQPRNTQSSTNP